MKRHNKTKDELMEEFIAKNVIRERTPQEYLSQIRKRRKDKNVVLGERVSLSIVLLTLTKSYEWNREEIKGLFEIYSEFLKVYEDDDAEELLELMAELKETTGYDVRTGTMEGVNHE